MRLSDKRKVIEVLLCTSDRMSPTMDEMIDDDMDNAEVWFERRSIVAAQAESDAVLSDGEFEFRWSVDAYDDCAITAAYRLIESSPTLRREWFGRP